MHIFFQPVVCPLILITSITKLKVHGHVLLYYDQPVVTVSLKDALLGMLEWMKSLTNNNIIMCGTIIKHLTVSIS